MRKGQSSKSSKDKLQALKDFASGKKPLVKPKPVSYDVKVQDGVYTVTTTKSVIHSNNGVHFVIPDNNRERNEVLTLGVFNEQEFNEWKETTVTDMDVLHIAEFMDMGRDKVTILTGGLTFETIKNYDVCDRNGSTQKWFAEYQYTKVVC
jgi:hypothetical protein